MHMANASSKSGAKSKWAASSHVGVGQRLVGQWVEE